MGARRRACVALLGIACTACGLSAVGLYAGDGDRTDGGSDANVAEGGGSGLDSNIESDGAITDGGADAEVGDACGDGGCLPIVLSRGHVSPVGIAVSGQRLFWSVDSPAVQSVLACDLPACATPVAIANGQPR